MSRARIIAATVVFALLGAMVPIVVLVYATWSWATNEEQERLQLTAERTLLRADRAYDAGLLTLRRLNQSPLTPCSAEHLQLLRALTLNTPSAEQIGYFEDGRLHCTSWGMMDKTVTEPVPDHVTAEGAGITRNVRPLAGDGEPLIALQLGSYDVLMNPARFVDVITDPNVRLALASPDGQLMAQQDLPDQALLQRLLHDPHSGMDAHSLYATAQNPQWLAIATAPRTDLVASFRQQFRQLLPLGVLGALGAVALVVWLSRRRLSLRGELATAVRRGEFFMHYQPIIELDTGICVGAESLVRWARPDGTQVRPDLFIPLAEEHGLIDALTDQVIGLVIEDMRAFLVQDRSAHIAINLSAADVSSGRALKVLTAKLQGTGIHPQQIWLEATERGFVDIQRARQTLTSARRIGHSVAIDDFGVGYSSLQYLQQLPLDALKIDKSFIDAIGTDSATSPVTPHIIGMAKTLGLFTVAEGIETADQLAYLQAHHVEFGQGWLFSKALPPAAFIAFHQQRLQQYGKAREDMQNRNSVVPD